jgi:uncharacterized oxidoreductase
VLVFTISETKLTQIVRSTVLALGAGESAAADMVASLVSANMEGMDSHGVLRLPQYVNLVDKGLIVPTAQPEVVHQDRAVTLLDGHWGFGQVGARVAARMAVASARAHGLGAAGIFHVLHVGRLKDYVQIVGRQNMIAMAYCSAGPAGGAVAPFRGGKRRFGTNPLAFAAPRLSGEPLVADFATSLVAEGKLRLAVNKRQPVAEGAIIDGNGNPTTNPNDYYAGGALWRPQGLLPQPVRGHHRWAAGRRRLGVPRRSGARQRLFHYCSGRGGGPSTQSLHGQRGGPAVHRQGYTSSARPAAGASAGRA